MRNEELYISVLDAMLQSPVMDNTEKYVPKPDASWHKKIE